MQNSRQISFCKKLFLVFLLFYSFSGSLFAQTKFVTGEIIDEVINSTDATQSYALYLPKNYTSAKKWAILYAFEPLARGKLPVSIYQEAAEKYGYIVVGSYNSRNGMNGETLSKILSALWDDTHQRLSIDERRVYTTGFSGGSRVAVSLAASCGCVTGVIGNGAGFPAQLKPSPNLTFAYFNATGFDDYNYYEIRSLRELLEKNKLVHRIEKFDGVHQWLTKSVAEDALAWMQLNAMKKGDLEKDEKFISEVLQSQIVKAESYLAKSQFLESFQTFSAIIRDFTGLKDVSEYQIKIEQMKNSDDLKKAIKDEANQISTEEKHKQFLLSKSALLNNPEERLFVLPILRKYIADLRKDAESKQDSSERRIARRALTGVFAQVREATLYNYEREKQYNAALINLEIASEISPKHSGIAYEQARVYARLGQEKKCLQYLEKAVELGFNNRQEVESEKAFDKMRQIEKFQKLLAQIKK